jgi:hypothetical protein
VRAAIDEGYIRTSGMLMYLEDVRVQVRGDSRDELITAEGFMEAQVITIEIPLLMPY